MTWLEAFNALTKDEELTPEVASTVLGMAAAGLVPVVHNLTVTKAAGPVGDGYEITAL
jgi:hypothetical protein